MVGVEERAWVDALGFHTFEGFDKRWLLGQPWQVDQPQRRSERRHCHKQQATAIRFVGISFGRIKVV